MSNSNNVTLNNNKLNDRDIKRTDVDGVDANNIETTRVDTNVDHHYEDAEMDRSEIKHMSDETKDDLNVDPITGEPGSHPVGTTVGGLGGAAAGAAIGSMAGPLGTLIGGAIGAITGGVAGHASAEGINPTLEDEYWRAEYANTGYFKQDHDFERDYRPAYAVGYANRHRYPENARFEDHEVDLKHSWEQVKGDSRLTWEDARPAMRDAWTRVG